MPHTKLKQTKIPFPPKKLYNKAQLGSCVMSSLLQNHFVLAAASLFHLQSILSLLSVFQPSLSILLPDSGCSYHQTTPPPHSLLFVLQSPLNWSILSGLCLRSIYPEVFYTNKEKTKSPCSDDLFMQP